MANTAHVTQSAVEFLTSAPGTVQITQDAIEFVTGAGITCGNPPSGTAGVFYSHTFPSGGGTPPYTFSITAGSLPPGITLNTSTGVISGTPTTAGSYSFTVTILDIVGTTSSASCSIVIGGASTNVGVGGGPYIIPKPCLCDIADLAAEQLQRDMARKREFPYKWSYPPPWAIRESPMSRIAIPTVVAGPTVGLTYTVDQGFMFALEALIVEAFTGSVLPGDFLWSLDLNAPENAPFFQGAPIQGFTLVDVPLGSTEFAWPLECPELFSPNDTIRAKFTNVNLSPGAPNYFKTILLGWRWAVTL